MTERGTWFAVACALMLSGCFAARGVRPVGEGKVAAGLSVGGPMFTNLGGAIPTPLMTGYARYGLTDKTDLDFGLSLPVIGAMGVDVGASRQLLTEVGWRPAVSVGGRLNFWANLYGFTGGNDANGKPYTFEPRIYEEAYAYASWSIRGSRSYAYVGLDLFAQIEELAVRPTLLAGAEWRANRLFGLQLELKQMAFTQNQRYATVDFLGPADLGAFAVNLGFNFYPGATP